jgi:hypothetical protein
MHVPPIVLSYVPWAVATIAPATVFVGACALWRWRRDRALLLLPVLAVLPLGACGAIGVTKVTHDLRAARLAHQMGVGVWNPLFTSSFPEEYLRSERVLVRGTTTRAEVHVLTAYAYTRYRCHADREAFYFYASRQEDAIVVEVRYDSQDRVREVWPFNDSLRLFAEGCPQF